MLERKSKVIKQIAWNTFKNTGNINTMLELIEVDKIKIDETNILKGNIANGDNKNQGNSYITK